MPGLADQQAQPHHTQITTFALGMTALGQLARRDGGNVRVEIGRVEGQHIRRESESRNGRLGNRHLCLFQSLLVNLLGYPMKRLTAEGRARQTRQARHAGIQKVAQVTFGSRRAGSLNGHRDSQLANGRTVFRPKVAAGPINMRNEFQLLGDPDQSPDVADGPRPNGARGGQVRDWRTYGGPQHDLAGDRTPADRVPNRLGGDSVAATVNLTFKDMHILSCSIYMDIVSTMLTGHLRRNRAAFFCVL